MMTLTTSLGGFTTEQTIGNSNFMMISRMVSILLKRHSLLMENIISRLWP